MIRIYVLRAEGNTPSASELPFGDAERERIEGIKNKAYRAESIGGLTALWCLLEHQGVSLPRTVLRDENGKPYIKDGADLPFSISHSDGVCAAALGDADSGEIGLDIEVIGDRQDAMRISDRFFSEDERRELEANGCTAEAFYSIWTAKEAKAKLDGKGLSACLGNDTDTGVFVARLMLNVHEKKVALALACRDPDQSIQIFTDTED